MYMALRLFNLHLRSALLQLNFHSVILLVTKFKKSCCCNGGTENCETVCRLLVYACSMCLCAYLGLISGDTVPLIYCCIGFLYADISNHGYIILYADTPTHGYIILYADTSTHGYIIFHACTSTIYFLMLKLQHSAIYFLSAINSFMSTLNLRLHILSF
jgi:uncharacterized membrane protein